MDRIDRSRALVPLAPRDLQQFQRREVRESRRSQDSSPGWLDELFPGAAIWRARRAAEVEQARLQLRRRRAEAWLATNAVERSVLIQQEIARWGLDVRRALVEQHIAIERLLLERAGMHRQPEPPPHQPSVASLREEIDDRQVESLALRAATRFSQLPPETAPTARQAWEEQLRRRFPANVAAEVLRRTAELTELLDYD